MTTLLEALTQIKRRPVRRDQGICGNVRLIADNPEILTQMRDVMGNWPDAAQGDKWYPVEGSMSLYMRKAREGMLWESPRRIALLDWLIEELS